MTGETQSKLEASFSTLVLSIGSSAAMAIGIAPNPETGETHIDKALARFNIDLLVMLQEKTQNNLQDEEKQFLNNMVNDLQMKYVALK